MADTSSGVAPNWRDTYRHPRLFIFDARLAFLVLPTLLHVRTYTVALTVCAAILLYYFEKRRSMDVASSLRMIRALAAGTQRPTRGRMKIRLPVDYDRIDRAAAMRAHDRS